MPDFSKILNTSLDEVKAPVPVPPGTYAIQITKHELNEFGQKKTPGVKFSFKLLSAYEDVDQDELAKVENWQSRELNKTYWLTEDSIYRVKDAAKDVFGIKVEGRSLGEIIEEFRGQSAAVNISVRIADQGGTSRIYNEVGDFIVAA